MIQSGTTEAAALALLTSLPRKIVQHYEVESLSQIVLHELGHAGGLGMKRATYLLDNPDFDHLAGIAGFCTSECHMHHDNIWENPTDFTRDMGSADFHNKVRLHLQNSFKRTDINLNDSRDVAELAKQLGFSDYGVASWQVKHGNFGILLYEQDQKSCVWEPGLIENVAPLLSLCSS